MDEVLPIEPQRFLLCKTDYEVSILWLDPSGSCSNYHEPQDARYPTRFHRHRDALGRSTAFLCPNGLESSEWARVFVDSPPGAWVKHFQQYASGPARRLKNDWQEL